MPEEPSDREAVGFRIHRLNRRQNRPRNRWIPRRAGSEAAGLVQDRQASEVGDASGMIVMQIPSSSKARSPDRSVLAPSMLMIHVVSQVIGGTL